MYADHESGGTRVAIYRGAMRWSETITIYLAMGAPFAVSFFLHARNGKQHIPRFLKAAAIALLWPLAVIRITWVGSGETNAHLTRTRRSKRNEANVNIAKRGLLAALNAMNESVSRSDNTMREELQRAACVLRESIETYVGLAGATEELAVEASPTEKSKELHRIAGYKGDDLAVAARCANRRNIARIIQHHIRARVQMVHSIADIREAIEAGRSANNGRYKAKDHVPLSATEVYKQAIDLLRLLGDDETASRIAELCGQEVAQRRRSREEEMPTDSRRAIGEGPCTTHTSRITQSPLSNETTMAQG